MTEIRPGAHIAASADAHAISAVTGLADALASKAATAVKTTYLTSSDDLNLITEMQDVLSVAAQNSPEAGQSYNVEVRRHYSSYPGAWWATQRATSLYGVGVFSRVIRSTGTITPWIKLGYAPLFGTTTVNLGDSIFGNTDGADSVSQAISADSGTTALNCAFGGSRIAAHAQYWDAFSLYRLADEIVKDSADATKWVLQDEAIAAVPTMPGHYEAHLQTLKDTDFATTDFITIAGGTNDFTSEQVLLDNEGNLYDTTTYAGSLRYSLEKLWSEYPGLKIVLCTPIYRFWYTDGVVTSDSDDMVIYGQKLTDFVAKMKAVGSEYKIPVVDNYYELGINAFNRLQFFTPPDGTHPNATGNKKLGQYIASRMVSDF